MVGFCHLTDSHHYHYGQNPTMVGICHGGNMPVGLIIVITIIIIVIFIIAARVTNSWSSPLVRGFQDHHHIPPLHHYYWHHSASFLSRSTRLITGKVCSRSSFTRLPSPRYQTPGRRIRDASIVGRKLITSSADRIRDSAATTLTPNVERLLINVFSTRWS